MLDVVPTDPVQQQYNFWLSLVDKLGVKAFVDLTLSPSVRQGTQHLLRITGLGEIDSTYINLGRYFGCSPIELLCIINALICLFHLLSYCQNWCMCNLCNSIFNFYFFLILVCLLPERLQIGILITLITYIRLITLSVCCLDMEEY